MVKITWKSASLHAEFFAICDVVSGWELAYILKNRPTTEEVQVWDLSGNEISLGRGYASFVAYREISRDSS